MSFIKVKDPRKREELIRDFIETRKRIKDNFVARKVGESEYQTGLTKLFKPITETQKATAKEITEAQKAAAEKITQELLPIKESIEKLPEAITFPAYPSIEMTKEEITNLGPIATNALVYSIAADADKTYGINPKKNDEGKNKLHIGNTQITIKNDDIYTGKSKYPGSSGFWKLITEKTIPNISELKPTDIGNYMFLMYETKTTYIDNDPTRKKRGGTSKKLEFIKPFVKLLEEDKMDIFDEEVLKLFKDPKPSTSGTGLKILPSDPNALIDRFDLLFSSKKAGHTGVRNEIVSILDELKRQGVLKTNEYKKLNSLIKK